jgi:hypothetical protein
MKTHIQISAPESLSFAWAKFKENWKTLTIVSLITFAASLIFAIAQEVITSPYIDKSSVTNDSLPNTPSWAFVTIAILSILNVVISLFFGYNMLKMVLKVIDNQKVVVKDLFNSVDKTFWRWFGTTIVLGLIILVIIAVVGMAGVLLVHWSLALLAVPLVIYFIIKYLFAPYLVVDNKAFSIGQALTTSARMTTGIEWQLIGFGIVIVVTSMAIVLAGLITLVVGLIPAVVILSWLSPLATVHMYRSVYAQKFGLESGAVEKQLEA